MTHQSFVVTDPRTFDGDTFEVAERAVRQAHALAGVLRKAVEDAEIMARNAEMDRQPEPDAKAWPASPQGRQFANVKAAMEREEKRLALLVQAAGFNPKKAR